MKKQIIYIGNRFNEKNITRQAYLDPERDHVELWFSKKLLGYEQIGSVIEVEVTPKGDSILYGSARLVGKVSEELHSDYLDKVTQWSADNRVILEQKKVLQEEKKPHNNSVDLLIEELVQCTSRMSRKRRALFALHVYNKLI